MKNKIIINILSLSMLFVAFSCSSDTVGDEKEKKIEDKINLSKDYRTLFPQNGVRDGVSFINQLYLLNKKVDKTTLYSKEEFIGFNEKPINGDLTIKKWTANSEDLFKTKASLQTEVKNRFSKSIDEIITLRKEYVKNAKEASVGQYGHVGTSVISGDLRYVNGKGMELSEVVEKQIMGIILLDQIINNHLGNAIMQNASLREKNTKREFMSGRQYTELEYHWDLAYALVGLENSEAKPLFIANYLINQFQGADFLRGVDKKVFDAFKKGRLALSKADYKTAEEQIGIIRENISLLYATRCVHYLKQAKRNLIQPKNSSEYHKAFHPLSESYGFILSFIVTRKADGAFYIQDYNVIEQMIKDYEKGNGFWEQDRLLEDENTPGSLDNLSKRIGEIFGFDHKEVI
ncbi:DUF4856 domain-containing protein [Weeksellaceae bacterium TAE3-ERU29]|nr:DUF4856 domain-containing protein [Weeksellaceae bacterium TAE3-ERU29]